MSRLYLVDEHTMVREGIRALLEAAGHEVIGETDDPTQALADLRRLTPDIVLLDINLGMRSGLELLAEMGRRNLAPPCIVLTMSAQPRVVSEAVRMGAWGYVFKGSRSSELLAAITSVAQGRRHIEPEIAALALQSIAKGDDEKADPMAILSPRERQIIVMVANGQSSARIGQQLHLSAKTVDTYRSRLMSKLGVGDLPALVRLAVRCGLVDVD